MRPPQPAPAVTLTGEDGGNFDLPSHLRGKTTAVQLMFTGCSATCPIQGALFASVAKRLPRADVQLLSISIDPLTDDPRALRSWLARFAAHPSWRAASPRVQDVDRIFDFLRGRAAGSDRHTGNVYLFDAQSRLAFRTAELPPVAHVVEMLGQVAALR